MKKLLLFIGILFSLGLFCACNNSDELTPDSFNDTDEFTGIISPIEKCDGYIAITNFFNSELLNHEEAELFPFFENQEESVCFIINKKEEIESLYHGNVALPEIDFNNYTLIIGLEKMPHLLYKIEKQELFFQNGNMQLNLYVSAPSNSFYPAMIMDLYYWSLYPKIQAKEIKVITIETEKL